MDAPVLNSIRLLQHQVDSLLLYQSIFDDEIGQAFLTLLQTLQRSEANGQACLRAYGCWFRAIAAQSQSWQAYLLTQILSANNPFTQQAQQLDLNQLSPSLLAAARHDLQTLQQVYRCDGNQLSQWVQLACSLETPPVAWNLEDPQSAHTRIPTHQHSIRATFSRIPDWVDAVAELAGYYRTSGIGLFASYAALRWQSGTLVGISYPDPIRLDELVGYELQRDRLLKNTEALLAGYSALHVLLYGSRGSGKSSLVKSLLHHYGDRGLRLIEVAKSDLKDLTVIVDALRDAPQKFIIFVDDLSFEEDDDAYKALKVILEGNLTARPQNVVVYATSNRRHLIREFFGDRPRPSDADEVHSWDTVQEKLSFSDRFGLTLTFEPADQPTYLAIVHHLATLADISLEPQELDYQALQWATRHNGRSGRTARQFVNFLRSELALSSGS
ncbi:ATP-binding protein [Oculatella sp. LEGE 06141]|uniref:ATP-binding protein n=1 Tax=Oculatella sp. LEGE 06141 TaxID=1828648 RepID=UPI0018813FB2|nr:ATP-binding protein [Oculatella sp. LEGE 06141]MBE9177464.1 ATP-binding protein [Oculatella sp. LEGE 06141]